MTLIDDRYVCGRYWNIGGVMNNIQALSVTIKIIMGCIHPGIVNLLTSGRLHILTCSLPKGWEREGREGRKMFMYTWQKASTKKVLTFTRELHVWNHGSPCIRAPRVRYNLHAAHITLATFTEENLTISFFFIQSSSAHVNNNSVFKYHFWL